MPKTYNIHKAKTHFSQLVEEVTTGHEIVIAKSGKPVARLVPYQAQTQREPGRYKEEIMLSESLLEPLSEDELSAWEGSGS